MITIDGAYGEGGGQVLRSSLTLSMLTGQPFTISKIRANRRKPGLMRQHMTAVEAAATICQAAVDGLHAGSQDLTFRPGSVQGGDYQFSVGTAGSANLVLQTVLLPLMWADRPSTVQVEGGTHNSMAPPADFLIESFVPVLNRLGADLSVSLNRHGFYPAGGGLIGASVSPGGLTEPLAIETSGLPPEHCELHGLIAHLPFDILKREQQSFERDWKGFTHTFWYDAFYGQDHPPSEPELAWRPRQCKDSIGPGNVLMLKLRWPHRTSVLSAFGASQTSAEEVSEQLWKHTLELARHGFQVDPYLTDQLLLPMTLAGGEFDTTRITEHAATNRKVIEAFLGRAPLFVESGSRVVMESPVTLA